MNAKPTPRPWHISNYASYYHFQISGAGRDGRECERICGTFDTLESDAPPDVREANALHIVRCVNAYDELIDTLKKFVSTHERDHANPAAYATAMTDVAKKARAVLAKAEEA